MSDRTPGRRVELAIDGAQLAVVVAATFMLEHWSFERSGASSIVTDGVRTAAKGISSEVFGQAKKLLENAGVWRDSTSSWTRDLLRRRAGVTGSLLLTPQQLHTVIVALRACHHEFATNWDEFCVAAPGNIDGYEVGPKDLLELADRAEEIPDPG